LQLGTTIILIKNVFRNWNKSMCSFTPPWFWNCKLQSSVLSLQTCWLVVDW